MIFVNFKTYKEATAQKAVALLQNVVTAQNESKVPVIPVVQVVDARLCANTTPYGVWVQNIDPQEVGQSTGWTTVEAVAEAGVVGTFLNHSEHKISEEHMKAVMERCQYHSIETMVFASDLDELEKLIKLKPTYVAYEPPELIASQETSVAKAQPEVVGKAVEIAKQGGVRLVVGAGVKDKSDVKKCVELGAFGVAASSAIVKASDPLAVMLDMASGFK